MYLLHSLTEYSSVWKWRVTSTREDDKPHKKPITNKSSFPLYCYKLDRLQVLSCCFASCALLLMPFLYLARFPSQSQLTSKVTENYWKLFKFLQITAVWLERKLLLEGFHPKPNKLLTLPISKPFPQTANGKS